MRDDLRFELLSEAEIKKCLPADLCVRVCPLCVPLDTVGAGLSALASTITQQERCHATVDRISRKPVVAFDPMMRDLIEEVCIGTGSPTGRMWSFAGHDASVLGTHVPAGMMYALITGGISHAPEEFTPADQLVLGCQALCDLVVALHDAMVG